MQRKYRKFEVTADTLRGCRFFDELDLARRTRIARICEGRVYQPSTEIIRHLDDNNDVYFIVAGVVEATVHTVQGKVVNFQELKNGEMFGEVSALDGKSRTTSVVAANETTVVAMTGKDFRNLVLTEPELTERTIARLCALSRHLFERAYAPRVFSIPDQVRLEIYRELRRALRDSADESPGVTLSPAPTHKDIAERVGTTREQVTRVVGDLSERDLMRQDGRSWVASDAASLLGYLEQQLNLDKHSSHPPSAG